jgi:hypothetical protein
LGMEHRKPKAVSSKLDPDKQAAFIKSYENLLNQLGDDEAVLFGDAVHPTHAVRPVGCWAPKDTPLAVPQNQRPATPEQPAEEALNVYNKMIKSTTMYRSSPPQPADRLTTSLSGGRHRPPASSFSPVMAPTPSHRALPRSRLLTKAYSTRRSRSSGPRVLW